VSLISLAVLLLSMLPVPMPQQQISADGLCFARYVWDTSGDFERWRFPFPENTLGAIDFRSVPQQAAPGPVPQGYGVFALDDANACVGPTALVSLESLDAELRPLEIAAIEIGLGLFPGDIKAATTRDTIRELMAFHADATGQTRWKPVRGSLRDGYNIELPGYGRIVEDRQFDASHPGMIQTILVYRVDYDRHVRTGTDAEELQRMTGAAMLDIFGEMNEERADFLMAPQYRTRGWREPTTTVSDDFDRIDGELGANWTDDAGDADIVSNQWDVTTGEAVSRYSGTSLSTDDHYAEAVFTDSGHYLGPMVRKDASSTLTYYLAAVQGNKTDWQWYKRVSGTYTLLQTVVITTQQPTDTLQGRVDGSTLSLLRNAIQEGSNLTDTSITGNLQVGLVAAGDTAFADDFLAEDLVGAPVTRRIIRVN
jgi:hypothetical protein